MQPGEKLFLLLTHVNMLEEKHIHAKPICQLT